MYVNLECGQNVDKAVHLKDSQFTLNNSVLSW